MTVVKNFCIYADFDRMIARIRPFVTGKLSGFLSGWPAGRKTRPNARGPMPKRRFFHSFPRPKQGEASDATLDRGLQILALMKDAGLMLAPEIVEWDASSVAGRPEQLRILQRRACFTELSIEELPAHAAMFGPVALSFDLARLRSAGATPVIYAPQGLGGSALSQLSTFCVRGAYHTRYVLRQLQGLKEMSDPVVVGERYQKPVNPDYTLDLQNTDAEGKVVAKYDVPALHVRQVLQHVGFNNIPFDHSIGVLSVFLSMFYPTDNAHTGDQLGYYRQREWRVVAGDINFAGRPMGRPLAAEEVRRLLAVDPGFWGRTLTVEGGDKARSDLALVYDPEPGFSFFDLVEAVYVPRQGMARARDIVGSDVELRELTL